MVKKVNLTKFSSSGVNQMRKRFTALLLEESRRPGSKIFGLQIRVSKAAGPWECLWMAKHVGLQAQFGKMFNDAIER